MRRERAPVDAHRDRTEELRAALEALGAVPIDYAGTVHDRRGNPLTKVITPATVDALIAAVTRVRDVVDSRRQCPPGTGPCVPCSRLSQAWLCWRVGYPFYPGLPGDLVPDPSQDRHELAPEVGEEACYALNMAQFSGAWPGKYIAEWQWWFDRLSTAGAARPRRGVGPRG